VAVAATSVAALIPLTAAPAGAVSEPEVVVATGLNNPYKMSFGPDGSLYVAEAGQGDPGEENCVTAEGPEGEATMCFGLTGSVTKVNTTTLAQERVATGLPSMAEKGSEGNGAVGPVDVAVHQGDLYVVVGQGGPPSLRNAFGAGAAGLATVMKVTPADVSSVFADLAAFEAASNPDADKPEAATPDTNPFGIEVNPAGGFWAVDAGGNDVLNIAADGAVSLEAVLPFDTTDAPPFLNLPPGTKIPYQPVPTSITNGAAGLLVTQLTGFPFPVGASNVFALDTTTGALAAKYPGFTNVVDAAQGPDGSVYVLEFSAEGLLNVGPTDAPTSRLIQIRPDGTRKVLLQEDLFLSNGVAVGPDGMVYVSNGSQLAGQGSVIRVDPGVARDDAIASACDPDDIPGAGFLDVGANTHREAIDCLAEWGIIEGTSATTFAPQAKVRRDQVASIVARLIDAAGVDLPAGAPDAFSDDDGNVHEANINALAALDVLEGKTADAFQPAAQVTRAQVASILARAYEAVTGEALPAGPDAFTDDGSSVHEAAINAVAQAGWVNGVFVEGADVETMFNPQGHASRAQVSSMVARMLSTLVDEGEATLPA
jgi:glucose/arabinose dehydrogenase